VQSRTRNWRPSFGEQEGTWSVGAHLPGGFVELDVGAEIDFAVPPLRRLADLKTTFATIGDIARAIVIIPNQTHRGVGEQDVFDFKLRPRAGFEGVEGLPEDMALNDAVDVAGYGRRIRPPWMTAESMVTSSTLMLPRRMSMRL